MVFLVMLSDVRLKDLEELYDTPIVQQSSFWSSLKNNLGYKSLAIDFSSVKSSLYNKPSIKGNIISDLLVVLQQIDARHAIAHIPYGPELEPDEELQGEFLEELSECLRSFLPPSCFLIRYDLCWESYWAKDHANYDDKGLWMGEPQSTAQELRFNINTNNWNFQKASFNNLPSSTVFLDISKEPEALLSGMKAKTRYNIRLSQKKDLQIRSIGLENIEVWYELYRETTARNRLYLNNIEYFEAVLKAKTQQAQTTVQLLLAEWQGKALAALFLVISGNRGSYLYGASSSEHRKLMPTYALQWEAMMRSKKLGCTQYDMFGIAPSPDPSHPLYGLYKFKTGFGGRIYHSLGCWDYPLDQEKYTLFKASELRAQGYHLN
ncbi:MAG: peptidoglycan bridge formation glycyltransferase FemA/FemB family protein [Bacteroidales bacterium]